MDNGSITKWKAMVFSPGLTEDDTKEIMSMTRRKDMVCSTGQMVESMRVDGKMENNMESVLTQVLEERPNKENGQMERDSDGWHNEQTIL